VIVGVPPVVSEYSTEHWPDERVHCPLEGLKAPVPLEDVKVTVPVGDKPVTVAVQVATENPGAIVGGKHETEVGGFPAS